jgi:hypothetical protein
MFNRTMWNIYIDPTDLLRITLHTRSTAKCFKNNERLNVKYVFPLLYYPGINHRIY